MLYQSLFIIMFMLTIVHVEQATSYEITIEQNAHAWKNAHSKENSSVSEIQTIIDILLLSYQIAKESCIMIFAKLVAQEELLKFYTPSLYDSWYENLQIERNSSQKLEYSIETMKFSQQRFQATCTKMKSLAPKIIHTNPELIQSLIVDLKNALILWGKEQEELAQQLVDVQNEFTLAASTISDIKMIFDTMFTSAECKHVHLKEAAGFVSKTYKDIDLVVAHFTKLRQMSIVKMREFFNHFFYSYYRALYQDLDEEQKISMVVQATSDQKLPDPDAFFS